MRLADAFDIVLDLARQNVIEDPDDEALEIEQSRQEAAIAEVEEFVRTYDFDDAPDNSPDIWCRGCGMADEEEIDVFGNDTEGETIFVCSNCCRRFTLLPYTELQEDDTAKIAATEFDRLALVGVTPQWQEWYAKRAEQIRKEARDKDEAVAAFTNGFDGYGYGD